MDKEKVRDACKTIYLKEFNENLEELLEIFSTYKDIIGRDESLPGYIRELVKKKNKVTYCEFFRALLINFYDLPSMQKYIVNYRKAKSYMTETYNQIIQEVNEKKTE